jgi:diguanylate cyclase (GGDEF)-like protein/PAS domain S-box-containing protein
MHVTGQSGEGDRWLRSVVENSSEIVTIVGPDGTLRYASPAFGRMFGYDSKAVVGTMNVLDHVHPEDLPYVLEETEKVIDEGGITANEAEYRFRHKDGSWKWVESVGNYDPHVGGVVVTTKDVTVRKEAEERLRRAEQRYRMLVERVPAVVYVQEIGSPDSALYMSPQIEALTGYTPEECQDTHLRWRMVHPEDRERMQAEDERTGEPGEVFASEYRVVHRDGQTVWVRNESVLVEDEEGGSRYWQGFMIDITERRRVEAALKESEQRFRRSFDDAAIGMALVGINGRFLRANRSLHEILGYPEEELLGKTFQDVTHPDDLGADVDNLGRMLAGEIRTHQVEKRYIHSEGHVVWALLSVSVVHDEEGEPLYFVSHIQDVTEHKEAEEALRKAEERYRTLVERIPAVTFVDRADGSEESLYVSPQVEGMLGYTPEEWMEGRLWRERMHPEDRERILASDERFEAHGGPVDEEYRLLAKDGTVVWVREETVLVRGRGGEPLYVQGIMSDVTEKKALEERLRHQAFHDPLTDLPNRQLFVDRLGQALRRTRRQQSRVAVLFMDLDEFKVVNDSLGHEAGDQLLKLVAQRLGRCLRPEDTLARFGGDEFVVLIEAVGDPAEAVQVAERITEELHRPFIMEGRELHVAASIGISLGDARTHDPDALLREADTAMYRVKGEDSGYTVFDPTMYERAFRRLELENDLRKAIEREEFVVHYQPIVRLNNDGGGWRIEALVRWDHPERGLLDPDEFVLVAEESGLVVPMGELVLEQACRRAVEWQRRFPCSMPLVMCVNLSVRQLSRPDLAETVERVLWETGMEGDCLSLDVTETVYVSTLERNTVVLDRLKAMGVEISIDDFGTIYSSLSYLKRLPADAIKIDRSFVKGLGENVEDTAIVQMIVGLAHTLRMEVIAEGVESEEQARLLKELGCDFAQGFHFSKPLPPEEIPALLSNDTLT